MELRSDEDGKDRALSKAPPADESRKMPFAGNLMSGILGSRIRTRNRISEQNPKGAETAHVWAAQLGVAQNRRG
jgi:hypothetical protein